MTIDVLRLAVVTAGVLVCVVAFAATMKYLVDGRLEPGDALRFMLLMVPPMLAHVLPFAGGFAATLVYHRMALDNEMLAANAGGIGLRVMLVPALLAALLLGASVAYLNEQAIPRFLREMQRLITLEAPRLLANEVQRGRAVNLDKLLVYADGALRSESQDQDWGPDVRDHVSLARMVALQVDDAGVVQREFFAKQADLWFMSDAASQQAGLAEGVSLMQVRLKNSMTTAPGEGAGRAGFKDEVAYSWTVPQVLRDNPRYLTSGELRHLRDVPERMDSVESRRRGLAYLLAQDAAAGEIASALSSSGQVALLDRQGAPAVLRAGGLERRPEGWRLKPMPSGEIELEMVRSASPGAGSAALRTIAIGKRADVRLEASGPPTAPRLSIGVDLIDARTRLVSTGGSDRVGGETEKMTIRDLSLPSRPEAKFLPLGTHSLLEASKASHATAGSPIADAEANLRSEVHGLMRRITSNQHERWAVAAACLLMILTGALTALKFQHSLPLTVYLWSFIPALACVVTISGGQQTVVEAGTPGLFLLWAGIAGLGIYAFLAYRTVARH